LVADPDTRYEPNEDEYRKRLLYGLKHRRKAEQNKD
jgi:hypothetical protein